MHRFKFFTAHRPLSARIHRFFVYRDLKKYMCVRAHIYIYICMCTMVNMCVYRYVDLNADDMYMHMYERILDHPRLHQIGIGRTTLSYSLIAD